MSPLLHILIKYELIHPTMLQFHCYQLVTPASFLKAKNDLPTGFCIAKPQHIIHPSWCRVRLDSRPDADSHSYSAVVGTDMVMYYSSHYITSSQRRRRAVEQINKWEEWRS